MNGLMLVLVARFHDIMRNTRCTRKVRGMGSVAAWGILCGLGLMAGAARGADGVNVSPIRTSERVYAFGKAWMNDPVQHSFTLENAGSEPVQIKDIVASEPLRSNSKLRRVLGPGDKGSISVFLGEPREAGEFAGTVEVTFESPAIEPVVFEVKGNLVPPIEILPQPIVFLSAFRGERKTAELRLINREEEPLRILGLKSESPRFTVQVRTNEPGQRYTLELDMKADGPAGRRQDEIFLFTSSKRRTTVVIPANTFVKERVSALPEEVDFGRISRRAMAARPELAANLTQMVMVAQRGGTNFDVQAKTDVPFLIVDAEPSVKRDRWQVSVRVAIEDLPAGPFQGAIFLLTNDPEFPRLEIPVRGEVDDGARKAKTLEEQRRRGTVP